MGRCWGYNSAGQRAWKPASRRNGELPRSRAGWAGGLRGLLTRTGRTLRGRVERTTATRTRITISAFKEENTMGKNAHCRSHGASDGCGLQPTFSLRPDHPWATGGPVVGLRSSQSHRPHHRDTYPARRCAEPGRWSTRNAQASPHGKAGDHGCGACWGTTRQASQLNRRVSCRTSG